MAKSTATKPLGTKKTVKSKFVKASRRVSEKLTQTTDASNELAVSTFVVGQELYNYKRNHDLFAGWDFSRLLGVVYRLLAEHPGKKAFLAAQSEPKQSGGNVAYVPVLNIILCETEPPQKIGITTVQKDSEKVVDFSELGLSWIPAHPAGLTEKNAKRIYTLNSRFRFGAREIAHDKQLEFEQAMLYILRSRDLAEEPEEVGFAAFKYVSKQHKVVETTYEKGYGLKVFIDEIMDEYELESDERDLIEQSVRDAFKEKREKVKIDHHTRKAALENNPNQVAYDETVVVKLYPAELDESQKCSFVNRYYGNAAEVL